MTIDEYRRGIPNYKGENGQTVGMLCETKEQCITDDDGVSLPDKLEGLKKYTDDAYANSNLYTDKKIGELINGAPTTLDTLKEIADAMEDNADVVEALDKAVGSKVDQAEYDGHADNDTIHVTAAEKEAWSKNGGEEIQAIINGTTTVGNASQLGGKGASEYVQSLGNVTDVAFLNNCWNTINYECNIADEVAVSIGLPSGYYYIKFYANGANGFGTQEATHYYSAKVYVRNSNGNGFQQWDSRATTADLANYLPKSGGTVGDGSIDIPLRVYGTTDKAMTAYAVNGTNKGGLGFDVDKKPIVWRDGVGFSELLHSGNVGSYALPKGGGTTSGDITVDKNSKYLVDTRVGVKNIGGHIILLASSGGNIGLFDEKNETWVLKKDSNGNLTIDGNNTPLHTGNCYDYFKKQISVDGRQTNIDFDLKTETKASYRIDLATSAITGTKPSCDGFIQTFKWDSADGYGGQLLVPNSLDAINGNPAMQYRCCHSGVWDTSWTRLLDTRNSAPCVVVDTDPGVGASVSYADGTLIFVKE